MTPDKLLALANRIDHEELWRIPGMMRDKLTQEQKDRLDAAVNLRRYADLLGNNDWRIYPPRPGFSYRAADFDTVVEMAREELKRGL